MTETLLMGCKAWNLHLIDLLYLIYVSVKSSNIKALTVLVGRFSLSVGLENDPELGLFHLTLYALFANYSLWYMTNA